MKNCWESKLKAVCEEHDNVFGKNIELSFKDMARYLHRLEKVGSPGGRTDHDLCPKIEIIDCETIKIYLPEVPELRATLLLEIMTYGINHTECSFNKKKDCITLSYDW